MNYILILGGCGAGKSTLARKMHEILGLELIHLDQYYWKPNWVEPSLEEWRQTVESLIDKPNWIIDGNYSNTIDCRIEKCDTIIFLDYPTIKCLYRVLKRIFTNWGMVRPDVGEGCPEHFSWEFLHFVATFNRTKRGKLVKRLKVVENEKKIFIFRNDQEVSKFLRRITNGNSKMSNF